MSFLHLHIITLCRTCLLVRRYEFTSYIHTLYSLHTRLVLRFKTSSDFSTIFFLPSRCLGGGFFLFKDEEKDAIELQTNMVSATALLRTARGFTRDANKVRPAASSRQVSSTNSTDNRVTAVPPPRAHLRVLLPPL